MPGGNGNKMAISRVTYPDVAGCTYDRPPAPGEQAAAGRAEATARAALGDHRYDAAARQGADMGIGTPS